MSNTNCNCNCPPNDYLPPCPDIPLPPPRPLPPCPPRPGCTPGCSDQTPNYGLPLWKASDVTSWLMQINGAMLRIDTIMHDLALRTGINGLPDDLVTTVSKLTQDVDVLKCSVADLANKNANTELIVQNMNTQVAAIKTDLSSITINLTNLDTRVMTVDTKTEGIQNKVTLLQSDLNMISSTVDNLQNNLLTYQNATNQTLAEHTTRLADLDNSGFKLTELTNPEITLTGITPNNTTEFETLMKKAILDLYFDKVSNKLALIHFALNSGINSQFSVETTNPTCTIAYKFTGVNLPISSTRQLSTRVPLTVEDGQSRIVIVGITAYIAKSNNEITVTVSIPVNMWNRNLINTTNLKTFEGYSFAFVGYLNDSRDKIPELKPEDEIWGE